MRIKIVAVAMTIVLGVLLTAHAAEEKAADAKPAGKGRLTLPWSKVSGISDDQKAKIMEIHHKANDERKVIDKREHDEIMALLNDDQKKEAEAAEKDTKSTKKEATTKTTG